MSDTNIVVATFHADHNRITTTRALHQWDRNQVLRIVGAEALPQTFEAHFSNVKHGGITQTVVGIDGEVNIPTNLLMTGKRIYCWIYVTDGSSAQTEYLIVIPVEWRPMPEYYDAEDTGVFDGVVAQVADYAATATAGAENAGASASAAAASADSAAESASGAAASATAAQTAKESAALASRAASTAAQDARRSADAAAEDAGEAAQSARAALTYRDTAETSATEAGDAKADAVAAAQSASNAATAAGNAASGAGQAASAAGQFATSASQSASRAETAASGAEGAADAAESAKTTAVEAKTAAQSAQSAAETAATTATAKATEAAASATAAAQSASNAAQSKIDAEAAAERAEQAAATLTVDDALSDTSENPVQNKVITGEVTQVKNAINQPTYNLNTIQVGRYQYSSNQGKVISSGTTFFGLASKFPCNANTNYVVEFRTADNASGMIYLRCFDANEDVVLSSNFASSTSAAFTTPAGCVSLHVSQYRAGGVSIDSESMIQIVEGNDAKPFVPSESSVDHVARVGEIGNLSITEYPGYYNASGTVLAQTASKEVYTQRIDVALIRSLSATVAYSAERSLWLAYAAYDANGNFISRTEVKAGDLTKYTTLLTFGSGVRYVSFNYRKFSDGVLALSVTPSAVGTADLVNQLKLLVDDLQRVKQPAWIGAFPSRFKSCYDHLFVTTTSYIPHESLYHVRISKMLGFNVIEANVFKTSDGVYGVNHLDSGKFGNYFKHVDGETDISNISASSVTWAWIAENVRYNTPIVKYQTRPATLQEFLSECRQQNIIPFVFIKDADCAAIVKKYMGDGNFIAYGGDRTTTPNAIIYSWQSKTTKQEIIDVCESYGKPFIYGMSNPTAFTDVELKDIVDTLHELGYWIGTSYLDGNWYKYSYLGFDLNGAQTRINRLENGNICNIDTVYGFDDFTFANATEADGVLTYSADGTLSPDFDSGIVSVGAIDIQIEFTGTITVPSIGMHGSYTYTSTGDMPLFIAIPIFNGSNALTIAVASGTVIKDVKFKASKF